MANAQVTTRIDADLKAKAEDVLSQLGMSSADYTRVAFSQLVLQQAIPFAMRIPNAETLAAFKEGEADRAEGKLKSYTSVEKLMDDLDA